MTKADRLVAVLDGFLDVSADTEAAAVVSADGLPMASALPPDVEEDRLAAMSAALLTLGEKAAEGLGRGNLGQVFVEGEDGYVVLMAAGPHAVLVAITSRRAKVGLVLFEMRRASAQVAEVMAGEAPTPPAEESPAEAAIAEATPAAGAMDEPPAPFGTPEPVHASMAGPDQGPAPRSDADKTFPSWQ